MYSAIEKWQASALVLAIIVAVTVLALLTNVNPEVTVQGLIGLGNLLLGAGAVAHGVRQGSRATATGEIEAELAADRRS